MVLRHNVCLESHVLSFSAFVASYSQSKLEKRDVENLFLQHCVLRNLTHMSQATFCRFLFYRFVRCAAASGKLDAFSLLFRSSISSSLPIKWPIGSNTQATSISLPVSTPKLIRRLPYGPVLLQRRQGSSENNRCHWKICPVFLFRLIAQEPNSANQQASVSSSSRNIFSQSLCR